jgi:hypothetical protein
MDEITVDGVRYVPLSFYNGMKAEAEQINRQLNATKGVIAKMQAAAVALDAVKNVLGKTQATAAQYEAHRDGYLQGQLDAMGDPDEIDKEIAAHRAHLYARGQV